MSPKFLTLAAAPALVVAFLSGVVPAHALEVDAQRWPQPDTYVSNIAGDRIQVKFTDKDGTKRKLKQRKDAPQCKWTTYNCDKPGYVKAVRGLDDDRCVKISGVRYKVKGKKWVHVNPTGSAVKWYPIGDCGGRPWL